LAVFALGYFSDFEILDVFQRTELFLIEKKQKNLAFFVKKA